MPLFAPFFRHPSSSPDSFFSLFFFSSLSYCTHKVFLPVRHVVKNASDLFIGDLGRVDWCGKRN